MGYTTTFDGQFNLNKKLDQETHEFLVKFNQTRRVKRDVDPKYGTEGEFYVDGSGDFGQAKEPNITDYNKPPSTQPGLWCQWVPTDEGDAIIWDGGEKFYNYVEWIEYIADKILKPRGYSLSGEVRWTGEEFGDAGIIKIIDNKVKTLAANITYKEVE